MVLLLFLDEEVIFMMPQQLFQTIKSIGLTEIESRAYVALLGIGHGSADSVAQKAGLKRASTYVALESLLRQGLVLKVPRARKMIFIAKDPEDLYRMAEQKLTALSEVLPILRSFAAHDKQFNVTLYEGIEGIRKALWYKLDDVRNTEYRAFFGTAEHVQDDLKKILFQWNEHNAKNRVRAKAIAPEHSSLEEFRKSDVAHLREVKVVDASLYQNQNSIEIYADFVRIVMFDSMSAVIIESHALAKALSSIHEIMWRLLDENHLSV